ncbi:unnamed protein product [Malus baccata var. baccata]
MAALGKTDEFELKSSLLHHIPKFHGMSMEDPNKHLKEFEVVCSSLTHVNVDGSILKMKHQMKEELLLQYFYKGLLPIERQMLDASAGGALVDKTPMAAKTLIANRALNAQQYEGVGQRDTPRQQVNEVGETIQISGGGSPNNPNNKEALGSNLRASIPSNTHQHKPHNNLPKTPQAPKSPKPSNSANKGKEVPILINSNVVPPNVPFPRRFMQSKKEEAEKDILETFRKVQVNIPLLDAIKQVPRYAKFLKELCTTRKRISSKEVVKVIENVSVVLQRKMPTKCELKNDGVIIQLADRSNAYPKGVLEDVLVQVNHLIFLADFYVLEMDESNHSPTLPILIGRPFMKTAQTKIDVAKGSITMAFGGDMISFNISESVENTNDVRSCCAIDVIENIG